MTTQTLKFDAERLLALDRTRREARALQRSAYDDYNAVREKRENAQARAAMARRKADEGRGEAHQAGGEMAATVEAEIVKLSEQMASQQREIDALGTRAAKSGTLFRQCLAFAVENGLDVPDELAEEATVVRGAI